MLPYSFADFLDRPPPCGSVKLNIMNIPCHPARSTRISASERKIPPVFTQRLRISRERPKTPQFSYPSMQGIFPAICGRRLARWGR